MKRTLIKIIFLTLLPIFAFSKEITFTIMNDSDFKIDNENIDSIEFVATGGLAIDYKSIQYIIFKMNESFGEDVLNYSDSKQMFEGMHKIIHPEKYKSKQIDKLRMAMEIKPDSSNLDILEDRKGKIAFIIYNQVNYAYFCNHALCSVITFKGENKSLINHLQKSEN